MDANKVTKASGAVSEGYEDHDDNWNYTGEKRPKTYAEYQREKKAPQGAVGGKPWDDHLDHDSHLPQGPNLFKDRLTRLIKGNFWSLIGENGSNLKRIEKETKTKLKVIKNQNSMWRELRVEGSKEAQDMALKQIQAYVCIKIPEMLCTLCNGTNHQLQDCSYCQGCDRFHEIGAPTCRHPVAPKSLMTKPLAPKPGGGYYRSDNDRREDMGFPQGIFWRFPYKHRGVFPKSRCYGIDCEKGRSSRGSFNMIATLVVITGYYGSFRGSKVVYCQRINHQDILVDDMVENSGIHALDASKGIEWREAKADILTMLKGNTVYGHTLKGDWDSLFISSDELNDYDINAVDIADHTKEDNQPETGQSNSEVASLRDMSWVYRRSPIQRYDSTPRPATNKQTHNCEIDARSAMLLGIDLFTKKSHQLLGVAQDLKDKVIPMDRNKKHTSHK